LFSQEVTPDPRSYPRAVSVSLSAEEIGIPGLQLVSNFVTEVEEEAILSFLGETGEQGGTEGTSSQVSPTSILMNSAWERVSKRFVKHFGFRFDYASRTFSESLGPLPILLGNIAMRIASVPHVGVELDQVVILHQTTPILCSPAGHRSCFSELSLCM